MGTLIEIKDSEKPLFAEFYKTVVEAKRKEFEVKRKELDDAMKTLNGLLSGTGENGTTFMATAASNPISLAHSDGYNNNWKWADKIKFALRDGDKTASDVVEFILKYENIIRRTAIKSVSSALSKNSKEGGVFRVYKNARKENIYTIYTKIYEKTAEKTAVQ